MLYLWTGRKEEELSENRGPKQPGKKSFSLDKLARVFQELKERKTAIKEHKAWVDEATEILKTMAGDATVFKLNGHEVATLVTGQLNASLLSKEQPEIIERFTRVVTERKFDQEAFKQAEPELYEQYRAKRLVLSGLTEQ